MDSRSRPARPRPFRSIPLTVFRWVLLTLTCFRLTRIITTDDWPVSEWFRDAVAKRFGDDSSWATLVQCPWCSSVWISGAIFAFDHFVWTIPTVILAAVATMAVCGMLGTYDERP